MAVRPGPGMHRGVAEDRAAAENPLRGETGQVMTVEGGDDNLSVGIDTDTNGTVDKTITGVTAAQFAARVGEDEGQLRLANGLDREHPGSGLDRDFNGVDTSETDVEAVHDGGDTEFTDQWLKIPDERAFLTFCSQLDALADSGINPDQLEDMTVAPGGWTYFASQMSTTFGQGGTFARETGTKLRELQETLRQFADDLRAANTKYQDGKDGIWLSVQDVDEAVANISTATGGGSSSSSSGSSGDDDSGDDSGSGSGGDSSGSDSGGGDSSDSGNDDDA